MSRLFLIILSLFLPFAGAQAASQTRAQHYDVKLVANSRSVAPGAALTVAVVISPDKDWHIYWSNPGETGYPPAINWTLPKGATPSKLHHPVPQQLLLGGFASNVHEGETILLQDITFPAPLAAGQPMHLVANLDLLVCSEASCVPDPATLDLDLSVGDGAPDPAQGALFRRAQEAMPLPMRETAEITAQGSTLSLFLPGAKILPGDKAHVFGGVSQIISDGGAQNVSSTTNGLIITLKPGSAKLPTSAPFLLRVDRTDGTVRGYQYDAKSVPVLSAASGTVGKSAIVTFLLALGGALLGGLILNLMPCVFPILSLKAMALAKAGGDEQEVRAEALGYTIGATGMIMLLGAILLLLRSGGHAMGWAFQLQDSRVVALLLLLVTTIAVNMAGLFELPSLSVTGNTKPGLAGSIGTGALAAFIATPCTGPFMAGALGAALLLPAAAAMAIFCGLGLGLSLPFLMLGFWKRSRAWLPRPGLWMVKLRHALSLPMFATAVGLAWIIGRQSGADSMALAIAAATLLGVALWWYGLRQAGGTSRWPVAIPAAAAIALAIMPAHDSLVRSAAAAQSTEDILPFSAKKLATLRAQKRPVFVYMTADWCLSCKVNEATSLSSTSVLSAWKKAGVTVMRGDWTNGDPEITAFLKAYGSAGVPIYIWYPADGAPSELPQVLTPSILEGLASGNNLST